MGLYNYASYVTSTNYLITEAFLFTIHPFSEIIYTKGEVIIMNINNYYSQYYKLMNGPLFNNSTSSRFGNTSSTIGNSSINSLFNDYSMLKTNGYRNLVNSYYKQSANTTINAIYGNNSSLSNQNFDSKSFETLRDNAGELYTSSMDLASVGSKSLFKTNSEGQYDTEKISKAVESFVSNYNKTLDAAGKVSNSQASRTSSYMVSGTKAYENSLNKIGITIGKDNKLSLDTKKLQESKMSDIKSVFNGTTSYASNMATKAVSLSNTSSLQLTYNQEGNASYYYANLMAMKF